MTRRLRIIMGEERFVTAAHARRLIRDLEKYDQRFPERVNPRGVAHHVAKHPIACDDCGVTYWARDAYATHLGCKGAPPKQSAGF